MTGAQLALKIWRESRPDREPRRLRSIVREISRLYRLREGDVFREVQSLMRESDIPTGVILGARVRRNPARGGKTKAMFDSVRKRLGEFELKVARESRQSKLAKPKLIFGRDGRVIGEITRDNPPRGAVGVIPGKLLEIRYHRHGPGVGKGMAGLYKHPFKSGSTMIALADGSILIRPKGRKKLWVNLPH